MAAIAATDPSARYGLMMLTLIIAGGAGVLFVWFMFLAWRHAVNRLRPKARGKSGGPDLWQASGDRLVGKINQLLYEDRPTRRSDDQEDDYDAHTDDFDDDGDEDDEDDDEQLQR